MKLLYSVTGHLFIPPIVFAQTNKIIRRRETLVTVQDYDEIISQRSSLCKVKILDSEHVDAACQRMKKVNGASYLKSKNLSLLNSFSFKIILFMSIVFFFIVISLINCNTIVTSFQKY